MKRSLLYLLFFFWTALIYGQDFVVKNMHVSIDLHKEGYILVNEKIDVHFNEERHGIIRDIPYVYKVKNNKYTTHLTDISVSGHNYKVSDGSGMKHIKIGDADKYVNGQQSYTISYKLKGPFLTSAEYDEFYYNVTGNEWTAPIEHASFEVHLPDSLSIRYNDMRIFTGAMGSNDKNATISQLGNVISGETTTTLAEGEGLTFAIKLPKSYINASSVLAMEEERKEEPVNQWPFAALPMTILTALLVFWKKLRGKNDVQDIVPRPYPPLDLTPAEVGAFYDHIVHDRDVISLLPYWAYQGYLKIDYNKSEGDMRLTKIKPLDGERPDYEYTLFNDLFLNRDSVELSSLKYHFYNTNAKVKAEIRKEIIDLQLYDDTYRYWFKSWRLWLLMAFLIPLMVLSLVFGYWLTGVIFLSSIAAVIVLGSIGSKPSEKGKRVKQELLGFYQFLRDDDTSQYQELIQKDEKYFEKVYPYAVAFNLDKSWIKKIRPYQSVAPMWYGYYGPYVHQNHGSMDTFSEGFQPKSISSAFTSIQSSGGGGGFSGGSSGGGFGGGGGSSW